MQPAVSVLINICLSLIQTRAYRIPVDSRRLTGRSVSGFGEIKTHKHVRDVNQNETKTFGSQDLRITVTVVIDIPFLDGVRIAVVIRKLGIMLRSILL